MSSLIFAFICLNWDDLLLNGSYDIFDKFIIERVGYAKSDNSDLPRLSAAYALCYLVNLWTLLFLLKIFLSLHIRPHWNILRFIIVHFYAKQWAGRHGKGVYNNSIVFSERIATVLCGYYDVLGSFIASFIVPNSALPPLIWKVSHQFIYLTTHK